MDNLPLLYPPAPAGVPADLAKPGWRYRLQIVLMLMTLFLFLLLYLVFLAGALALMCLAVWPLGTGAASIPQAWQGRLFVIAFRVSVFAMGAMLLAFLVKGFFKRGEEETDPYLEVTEREQPELFHFIRSLCQEIACPVPARLYLSHDVNAAVFYPTSILNLVASPKKNLLLGLGLAEGLNLVELKALLAHELGHFSQRTLRLDGYALAAYHVIANIVNARDRWDDWVVRGFDTPWLSAFAAPLYALAQLSRIALNAAFRPLHSAHMSLRRQMEFNADLVAVSVAGSDAVVHLLLKCNFSQACLQRAGQDLALAVQQDLFSRDLFFHQQRAGDLLRTACNDPNLGRPPEPPSDSSLPGDMFQPRDASPLAMWADHPSEHDRERNAKRRYFRSPRDARSAWLLFRDQEALREAATRRFYRTALKREPGKSLTDPERVEAFINNMWASPVLVDFLYPGPERAVSASDPLPTAEVKPANESNNQPGFDVGDSVETTSAIVDTSAAAFLKTLQFEDPANKDVGLGVGCDKGEGQQDFNPNESVDKGPTGSEPK
jgi:Zn-dependent protease with chaperone function